MLTQQQHISTPKLQSTQGHEPNGGSGRDPLLEANAPGQNRAFTPSAGDVQTYGLAACLLDPVVWSLAQKV
jgi:hypothetical protein